MDKTPIQEAREKERWKKVKRSVHQISSWGRVRNSINGNILNPWKTSNGYLMVDFRIDGEMKKRSVARLVGTYWVANPNNYNVINHLNGNKQNNYYKNLEWTTTKGNIRHSVEFGMSKSGSDHKSAHLSTSDIKKIYKRRMQGYTYKEIGEELGVKLGVVWSVVNGRSYKKESKQYINQLYPEK